MIQQNSFHTVINQSINCFRQCSKFIYDENQLIVYTPHKAVRFNIQVVNLYKKRAVLTFCIVSLFSLAQEFYANSHSSPTTNCLK